MRCTCSARTARPPSWTGSTPWASWDGGELRVEQVREAGHPGSVTAYRPEIGGLLPVYVLDRYEGFEVKTFPDLTDAELDRYLDANVAAVRDVVAAAGEPDAALANHLIMGPVILARAGLRFAIKVHGSDISYTVRPHPERFVPFAREGTDAAAGHPRRVLPHRARRSSRRSPTRALPERTRLGPPGVDVHRFRPHPPAEALADLERLAERSTRSRRGPPRDDSFGRDGPAIAAAIRGWAEGDRARALRRQAAGQQGRRPAGGGLAAGPPGASRRGR